MVVINSGAEMDMCLRHLLVAFGISLYISSAYAGDLQLTIKANPEVVDVGTQPALLVTFTNNSSKVTRVLDFPKRHDLYKSYLRVGVYLGASSANATSAISDPGPIADRDYITLQPGQSVQMNYDMNEYGVFLLPPGDYTFNVGYFDEFTDWDKPIATAKTTFTISGKRRFWTRTGIAGGVLLLLIGVSVFGRRLLRGVEK